MKRLMPSRQTVSHLLYEEKAFAAEMAIRISIHVGGTPESLLRMQKAVALWEAGIKFKSNPVLSLLFRQASMAA